MTKSKRDITLGEMQDECKRIGGICVGIKDITESCKFLDVCPNRCEVETRPSRWDLTTPRFTDDQKAFLRGWMAIGAVEAHKCTITDEGDPFDVIDFYDSDGCCIATVSRLDWLRDQIEFGVDMELYDAIGDAPCAK